MANLKGSTFEKQIKDAFHRIAKFGESRYQKSTHFTHSDAIATKREMYLKDFAKYAENKNLSGKLNTYIGEYEHMKNFIQERTENLSSKSTIDYVSGFNSLLEGLKEANISIDTSSKQAIEEIRQEAKEQRVNDFRTNRAFENPQEVIQNIYRESFPSGILAEVQYQLGIRTNEAYELVKNYEKYIDNNKVENLIGKANHIYQAKEISFSLVEKIQSINYLPSHKTYLEHIKEAAKDEKATAHNFRYTFAKEKYENLIKQGISHQKSIQKVSKELNHNREEITIYYLARA